MQKSMYLVLDVSLFRNNEHVGIGATLASNRKLNPYGLRTQFSFLLALAKRIFCPNELFKICINQRRINI